LVPGSAATQQTANAGLQIGLGTKTAASEIIQTQGDFTTTGNPLDITIQGQGFFQVRQANGELAYTRAGTFHLDAQGNITTADGLPLQPAITIPPSATNISIGQDGTVSVTLPNSVNSQTVGQIQLATFPNPGGLNSVGQNLLLPTTASGDAITGVPGGPEGLGSLQQGMLESSNVSVVDEFVQMILTQRAYESNQKVVKAADEMIQMVNNLGH
jgi:flagellar basal-body rod protein FlgG